MDCVWLKKARIFRETSGNFWQKCFRDCHGAIGSQFHKFHVVDVNVTAGFITDHTDRDEGDLVDVTDLSDATGFHFAGNCIKGLRDPIFAFADANELVTRCNRADLDRKSVV